VRESLFGILEPEVTGARVLDVYAGSGALGFEALSRGAASVAFVESDRAVVRVLRENAVALGVEARVRILAGTALRRVASDELPGPFDLVLADPPYGLGESGRLLDALARAGTLVEGARVVLERDRASEAATAGSPALRLVRTARYGRTCLDFYVHEPGPGTAVRPPTPSG
jgi:16S rRNA (guanine966-N2)-methyltransferase